MRADSDEETKTIQAKKRGNSDRPEKNLAKLKEYYDPPFRGLNDVSVLIWWDDVIGHNIKLMILFLYHYLI